MFLIFIIITLKQFSYIHTYETEIKACQIKLDKVLTFIEDRYYEFNFDGLFGVVLAESVV